MGKSICLWVVFTVLAGVALRGEDEAAGLRRQPGEVLPVFSRPNLLPDPSFSAGLPGWRMLGGGQVTATSPDADPAVCLDSRNGAALLVSAPFAVEPGKKYLLTGVYHTVSAGFSSYSEMQLLPEREALALLSDYELPRAHTPLVRRTIFNCRPGQWRRVTRTYTIPAGQTELTLAIIAHSTPMRIYWSGIHIGELEEETRSIDRKLYQEWRDPKPSPEEVAARLAARPNSTAELRPHGDAPALFIDGRVATPHFNFGDAFNSTRTKRQSFQQAGVPVHFISLNNMRGFWRGRDDYDLAAIDEHVADSISKNPEGNFVVRVDLSPYKDWHKDYPQDTAQTADGRITTSRHGLYGPPDYWSEAYRQAAENYLRAVIRLLRGKEYYRAIVGIFPSGNEDQQFYYQVDKKGVLNDGVAPGSQATFRAFLRQKYGSDAALQQAWKQPEVTLATAVTPVGTTPVRGGNFLPPDRQQPVIDYITYLNVGQGEFANRLCALAKAEAGKPIVTVMWWGRGAALTVYPFYSQTSRVLPAPHLDFMGAQAGYYGQREVGSPVFFPWVFDSLRAHGKIAMDEGDYRTWQTNFVSLEHDYRVVRFWTLEDYRHALVRQVGRMAGIGGGYWHFSMTAGWYLNPEIMALIGQVQRGWAELMAEPAVFTPARLVVVADEDNYFYTTEQVNVWNGPNYHTIRNNQAALLRSGLKYDFYYLSDVMQRNLDSYQVYILSNVFYLTPEKRAFIERLKRDGKTLVFLYAPGYLTEMGPSLESMSALTGIAVKPATTPSKLARFVEGGDPLVQGLGGQLLGLAVDMGGEGFEVDDRQAVPLARFSGGGVAAARRAFPEWQSVYFATPSCLTPQFLQNLARASGIPVYNTAGDLFFHHRDDLVLLHGVEGNTNTLRFGGEFTLQDLISREELPSREGAVQIRLQPGESRLFRLRR